MTTTHTERRSRTTTLAQIVAIVGGVKSRAERTLTDTYHQLQRRQQFNGLTRTYRPRNDDDTEVLPAESTPIQVRASEMIELISGEWARLLDVVAEQEVTNTGAFADIEVDGVVIAQAVPVTYLMWLEKKVVDLRTFIGKLPVLDVGEDWEPDVDARAFRTPATETTRTKKVMRNHVKAEATDRHPAQVDVYTEDIVVGYWRQVKYSGALPASRVFELSGRADRLLEAVRFAREQANAIPVAQVPPIGSAVIRYLFA